jgi:hypothetical protein
LNTTCALPLRYPYEEFTDHVKALKTVRQWEDTLRFGHLGNAQSSRAHSARVVEYFSDSYQNQREAVQKADLFLSIYDYIGRNATFFGKKGLLEELGNGFFSVDPALLRSAHFVFALQSRPGNVNPKKVLNLARAFKELEPAIQ